MSRPDPSLEYKTGVGAISGQRSVTGTRKRHVLVSAMVGATRQTWPIMSLLKAYEQNQWLRRIHGREKVKKNTALLYIKVANKKRQDGDQGKIGKLAFILFFIYIFYLSGRNTKQIKNKQTNKQKQRLIYLKY